MPLVSAGVWFPGQVEGAIYVGRRFTSDGVIRTKPTGPKKPGTLFINPNDTNIYYVDSNGVARIVTNAGATLSTQVGGQLGRKNISSIPKLAWTISHADSGFISNGYYWHADGAHTDVAHHDSHSDGTSHSDSAHSDSAHSDSHTDNAHGDVTHVDTHTDSHQDGVHVDHSDTGHGDVIHHDSHSDSHSDTAHTDSAHVDSHSDTAHSDVAHNDSLPHSDSHSDSAHNDIAHSDQPVFIGGQGT